MSDPVYIEEFIKKSCEFSTIEGKSEGANACGKILKADKKQHETRGLHCSIDANVYLAPEKSTTKLSLICERDRRFAKPFPDPIKWNLFSRLWALRKESNIEKYKQQVLPEMLRSLGVPSTGLQIFFDVAEPPRLLAEPKRNPKNDIDW